MLEWIDEHATAVAARAEDELERLVAISSPSGDRAGAESCFAACAALLPDGATIERPPCSSPDHAADLLARLPGGNQDGPRVLLLGHVDTVVGHGAHRPLERLDGVLTGSGSVDMKGGVVLSLGVLRALAGRAGELAEVALLLVCDEEWRTAPFLHGPRFAGWDACLCFEAGERTPDGGEGVVVKRKAAGTLHVTAAGRAAHSGSAPDRGRNALLALVAAANAVAKRHDPRGEQRISAVPTVIQAGEAFNVVPDSGELWCDVRAEDLAAIEDVATAVPAEVGGATLTVELARMWPGMDARAATEPLLATATRSPRPHRPRRPPRRRQRRVALRRRRHPARRRRPRPARRLGPSPRRVRLRRVAAPARRGGAGRGRRGAARYGLIASDSSSRGRSSTSNVPRRLPSSKIAATPPFLKSIRPPVRSKTTWAKSGSWPTSSNLASSSSCACRSSSATSTSKSSASASTGSGSTPSASQASSAVRRARAFGLV